MTSPRPTTHRPRPRGSRGPLASLLLHATLIAACAIALFPVLFVAATSFKTGDGWQHPADFSRLGLSNYRSLFADGTFVRWFANSVIVAAGTTVFSVFLAASAGYAMSRMRFPGNRPLMWGFLVVQMFPVAVLIVPMYTIMADLHLINTYWSLILAYSTVAVPFCVWMLKSYFDTIPVEIDEAGRVDGLTPFGTFWRLVMPLARPGLAVTAFYSFLTAWGEVAYATTFMSDTQHYTLAVGLKTWVGEFKNEWGLMTAASVLITVPAALVFFYVQRHLVAGLTAGSTKS